MTKLDDIEEKARNARPWADDILELTALIRQMGEALALAKIRIQTTNAVFTYAEIDTALAAYKKWSDEK